MKKPLSFAELRTMSSARREQQLARILEQARQPPNGESTAVKSKLLAFEARYECSSEEMRARFAKGQSPETPDISAWMMLLELQDKVAGSGSASSG